MADIVGNPPSQGPSTIAPPVGSPAWLYLQQKAAADAAAAANANAPLAGTAAGIALKNENTAAGFPPLSGTGIGVLGTSTPGGAGTSFAAVPSPSLAGLHAAVGAGPSGSATPAGSAGGSTSASGTAQLAPVDTTAAETAAFGKTKDQVGQEASGALTGLRSALGSRGMLGSGLEERGTAAAATSAAGQLGDVSRQAAVTKADLAQKNAETNLTAGVTQRGQDIQKEEAGNTLAGDLAIAGGSQAVAQRGQDISATADQQRYALGQAQLVIQQRATSLAGLEAALKATTPTAGAY